MSEKWTQGNIPDLTETVAVVTGANSGIGFETAKQLTRCGATTILACRNSEKAQAAASLIIQEFPYAKITQMKLDLEDLNSVKEFSDYFKNRFSRLDFLVNNAGIMMVPYGKTKDGFERQFGTNHLGHFALTGQLIEMLLNTPNSRVVNVSSLAHRSGVMNFDNLMFNNGKDYTPHAAYGRSKLANLLFTYELQRRLGKKQASTIAAASHPGATHTNLLNHFESHWLIKLVRPLLVMSIQSAAMGALPSLRAATDPMVSGGQFFGPRGLMQFWGYPVMVQSNKASHNIADAQKLWAVSEQLTGIYYLD